MALWSIILTAFLGFAAVYLLLPRPRRYPLVWGAALAGLALVLGGWLLLQSRAFHNRAEAILFYLFAGIALLAGGLLITQRNPVHAALSFALVVLSTCGLFLLQAAPFLMAATIIIYAGAIVVTFLFVIMLAQQEGRSDADFRSREPLLSTSASFVLLGALLYVLQRSYDTRKLDQLLEQTHQAMGQTSPAEISGIIGADAAFFQAFETAVKRARGSPDRTADLDDIPDLQAAWNEAKQKNDPWAMKAALAKLEKRGRRVQDGYGVVSSHGNAITSNFSVAPKELLAAGENVPPLGRSLFTDYMIAVELAGTLLLVAAIGAIAIAGRRTEGLR